MPVLILKPEIATQDFLEPNIISPDVHIMFPPLGVLKTFVDRMKHLSSSLKISANMAGDMMLTILGERVSIEALFKSLENPVMGTVL